MPLKRNDFKPRIRSSPISVRKKASCNSTRLIIRSRKQFCKTTWISGVDITRHIP